jgi:hypothetical protein
VVPIAIEVGVHVQIELFTQLKNSWREWGKEIDFKKTLK